MKRFMADFIDTSAATPEKYQHQQTKFDPTSGVTFKQPEKKRKDFLACHACGYNHKGGLDNYTHTFWPVRTRTKKLVKTGVFYGASDGATTNTAVRKPIT